MYEFLIDRTKISKIILTANTDISSAILSEGDHNQSYNFKCKVRSIEFTDGNIFSLPDIKIETLYNEVFNEYYFKILKHHYEQASHIPFYIEENILSSATRMEEHILLDITSSYTRLTWRFNEDQYLDFIDKKIRYIG